MTRNGEDLTARITKMIADATQQEWDALTDSAWAHYCEWLAEQRSAAGDSLTIQLAKLMFEDHAGLGWGGVSESVREIYTRAADTVITHLTATGCLLADDEMRLTAEQVEDVTAVASWALHQTCPSKVRERASRIRRALFPATEPAEEETKAERRDPDELAKRMALIWEGGWDEFDEKERDYLRCAAEIARAYYASSPVVPAPTETGPWQDISEAPKHLTLIDRVGDKWTYDGDNWVTPETAILPVLYINRKYAPFVAAEER